MGEEAGVRRARGAAVLRAWAVLLVGVGAVLAESNTTMSVDLFRSTKTDMITTMNHEQINRKPERKFGELTEMAKNFRRCSNRRVVETGVDGRSNGNCIQSVNPPWVTRFNKDGICGEVYRLSKGDRIKFRRPRSQHCEMQFQANPGASLSFRCNRFSIKPCTDEFLYVTDGVSIDTVHCEKDKPKFKRGLSKLLLVYQRQRRRAGYSRIFCIVRGQRGSSTGGGGGGSTGGGGSGGGGSTGSGGSGGRPPKGKQAPGCAAVCGAAPQEAGVERIVGGKNANVGEYPWMVLLEIKCGEIEKACGGSILTSDTILTAAHCIECQDLTVKVLAGVHNQHTLYVDGVQASGVSKYTKHPGYNSRTQANDIALLRLEKTLSWTSKVGPICLAYDRDYERTLAVVTGWGTTSYLGEQPDVLMEVGVKVTSHAKCHDDYKHTALNVTHSHVCASSPGKDSCQGDSGGPLVVLEGGVWYQIGIVSYGIGCADSNYDGVYTRVSSFVPWILKESHGSC